MLTTVTCKTYVFLNEGEYIRWDAADLGCKKLGGHLARPISEAETAFLMKINKMSYYWIDAEQSGATYVWSDRSSILHTDWDTSNGSCSSIPGCHIGINPDLKWYVAQLDDKNSAICELPLYHFNSGPPVNDTVDDMLQKLVSDSTTHDLALKLMTDRKLDRSEMEAFKLEHQENARKSVLEFQKTIQGSYLNVSFEQVFRELLQQSQENLMQRQLSCSIAMSEFEQHYQEYGRQSALNTSHQLRNIALALHKDRAKLYVVSSESLMYLEAKEYCKINGGHVVRLQDEYEAEYIASQVTESVLLD
ncbi:hypothetical protein HDE_00165 [Halotydeus destructor]|nr:hypothetical protein HDE_00165 [Halotydeus destructor]